jgi:hypothetical protein
LSFIKRLSISILVLAGNQKTHPCTLDENLGIFGLMVNTLFKHQTNALTLVEPLAHAAALIQKIHSHHHLVGLPKGLSAGGVMGFYFYP